jgi:hypothetical protein
MRSIVPSHGSSNSGCAKAKSRRRTISACCSSVSSSESSSPSNSRRFSSNHTASRCRSCGSNSRIALSSCSKLTTRKSSVSDSRLQRFTCGRRKFRLAFALTFSFFLFFTFPEGYCGATVVHGPTPSAVSTISTAKEHRISPITRTRTDAPWRPITFRIASEKSRRR